MRCCSPNVNVQRLAECQCAIVAAGASGAQMGFLERLPAVTHFFFKPNSTAMALLLFTEALERFWLETLGVFFL